MNLGQLRTAVERRTGLAVDTTAENDLINEANRVIAAEWDWPWLESAETLATVIGTATVTPGATYLRTIDLRINNGVVLRRAPIDRIDFLASAGTGEPRLFAVVASTITLFPTPSAVLSLQHRFVRSEPDLVIDADTPLMPAPFHSAIAEYAAYVILRRAREDVRAAEALKAYEGWLEQMRRRASRYADTRGGGAEIPKALSVPAPAAKRARR